MVDPSAPPAADGGRRPAGPPGACRPSLAPTVTELARTRRRTGRRHPKRTRGRRWRAIVFAPVGDGQTRRRGSDAVRLAWPWWRWWCAGWPPRPTPTLEHTIATTLGSPPDGVRWLISSIWWIASLGVIAVIAVMALMSRRSRPSGTSPCPGGGAWLLCIISAVVLGTDGGRPPTSALHPCRPGLPGGPGGRHRGCGHRRPALLQPVAAAAASRRPSACWPWPPWSTGPGSRWRCWPVWPWAGG